MQLVNITGKNVYTRSVGMIRPGSCSKQKISLGVSLENALRSIVGACGDSLGIRLSGVEAELLKKVVELDELGCGFNPESIPDEERNDPTGEARFERKMDEAQRKEIESVVKANEAAAQREAIINGEVAVRSPVGPATLKGEPVTPEKLKTGFERIMEENERIRNGEKKRDDENKVSDAEILDPIGAHMRKDVGDSHDSPEIPAQARGNAFDRLATETAEKLSKLGPVDDAEQEHQKGSGKPKEKVRRGRKSK